MNKTNKRKLTDLQMYSLWKQYVNSHSKTAEAKFVSALEQIPTDKQIAFGELKINLDDFIYDEIKRQGRKENRSRLADELLIHPQPWRDDKIVQQSKALAEGLERKPLSTSLIKAILKDNYAEEKQISIDDMKHYYFPDYLSKSEKQDLAIIKAVSLLEKAGSSKLQENLEDNLKAIENADIRKTKWNEIAYLRQAIENAKSNLTNSIHEDNFKRSKVWVKELSRFSKDLKKSNEEIKESKVEPDAD